MPARACTYTYMAVTLILSLQTGPCPARGERMALVSLEHSVFPKLLNYAGTQHQTNGRLLTASSCIVLHSR